MAKSSSPTASPLACRAFFVPPIDVAPPSCQVTNAVFGFTSMLVDLLKDHRPDSIGGGLRPGRATYRHEDCKGELEVNLAWGDSSATTKE